MAVPYRHSIGIADFGFSDRPKRRFPSDIDNNWYTPICAQPTQLDKDTRLSDQILRDHDRNHNLIRCTKEMVPREINSVSVSVPVLHTIAIHSPSHSVFCTGFRALGKRNTETHKSLFSRDSLTPLSVFFEILAFLGLFSLLLQLQVLAVWAWPGSLKSLLFVCLLPLLQNSSDWVACWPLPLLALSPACCCWLPYASCRCWPPLVLLVWTKFPDWVGSAFILSNLSGRRA